MWSSTLQVNRKFKRETDGLGRLIKVTEQDATGTLTQETSYTYNVMDKLTGVNQGNQTRAYKYDALGRLLYERIPEQTATINDGTGTFWTSKYTYTDFDAVATKQDARGVITTYSYDNLHRVTGISYNVSGGPGVASTPPVTFTYDTSDTSTTKGLLLSIDVGTNGSVYRESYTFDSFNRVSTTAHRIDTQTYTTNFEYNAVSQPTRIAHIYPEYDNKARLFALWNGIGGWAYLYNVNYNIAGQVISDQVGTNGGYVNESYGYDTNRMQLTTQTATKAGNTLMNLTYNYQASAGQMGAGTTAGNAGQLMSISGTINGTTESASYKYDLLGRLFTSDQTSNGSSAQRKFAYDRWGNRTTVWPSLFGGTPIQSITLQQSGGTPTNQIASVTNSGVTVNYLYDAAGNVTYDGAHSYVYDAENRIVSMDSGASTYAYDHQNRRIKKVVGSSNTHYVWEGSQVIAEYNGSTGAQLVWYYAGSRMISKIENGALRYFLSDRLSARVVLDLNGNVIGRLGHLPFGEDFGESGTQEKHHFTSYEMDGESGNDYAINRQYAQSPGRFLQVDPLSGDIDNPQNVNKYGYAANDPIDSLDPLGLEWRLVCTTPSYEGWSTCRFRYFPDPNPVTIGPPPFSGGGGGQIDKATKAKQALAEALRHMGPGCTKFFGGQGTLNDRADDVDSGKFNIKFVAQGGPGWYDSIPGAPSILGQRNRYVDFWRNVAGNSTGAATVAYTDLPPQTFMTIILGNIFFKGSGRHDDIWRALPADQRNLTNWQNVILVHEYMHLLNNTGDQGLVDKWTGDGADFGNEADPSLRLSVWLAKDCPNHKK